MANTNKRTCTAQAHLSCAEYGLWDQYRKLSFTSGKLFEATKNTAQRFAGESRSSIERLRSKLVEKGWLVVTKKSVRNALKGRATPATYKVLDHEQWTKIHGRKHCSAPCPEVSTEGFQPCSEVSNAMPKSGQRPCSVLGSSIENIENENKTEIEIAPSVLSSKKFDHPGAQDDAKQENVPPYPEVSTVNPQPYPEVSTVPQRPRTTQELQSQLGSDGYQALCKVCVKKYGQNYSASQMLAEALAVQV